MDFTNFLLSVVSGAALSIPSAAWLAKKFVEARLDKELEQYKSKLKKESDLDIEHLKSKLQSSIKEREITVAWLHQKRANAIEGLYSSMIELHHSVRIVLYALSPRAPSDIRKYTKEAYERIQSTYLTYHKTRIFLSHETCAKVEDVLDALQDPLTTYYGFLGNYDDDELHTLADVKDHSWKELRSKIFPAMKELESEFRTVLGVYSG
ncbi:hypothetical protein KV580_29860 [Pseudomonas chlororaphis]|nr:hypothetical protein [Pseudomonas chlororaphis]